jgi:hypothetical protein
VLLSTRTSCGDTTAMRSRPADTSIDNAADPAAMSATPDATASNTSKAGTNSPAAYTAMSSFPPESARTRSAMRSADIPGPGNRFGQDVTMRHFCAWARAIPGAASTPAVAPAARANVRLVVMTFSITHENDAAVRGRGRS